MMTDKTLIKNTTRTKKNNNKPIETIAVLVAMEAEAAPLVSLLGLKPCPKSHRHAPLPSVVRSGAMMTDDDDGGKKNVQQKQKKRCEVVVATCGADSTHGVDSVGTVNAALCAYEILKTHEPDVLINAGTAGGFREKGARIGDVFLVDEVKYHDRRIPIPTFTKYGVGAIRTAETPNMRKTLKDLKCGVCSTGNSLDATEVDREMMSRNDASVKEMEAAAVAKVCEMFDVPFVCVKAITDIVDGPHAAEKEFLENLAMAGKRLQETVPKVLEFMRGKTVADL
mmetsp:Transcript_8574/g.25129  ORF Transcript_8574/g.25129 Transcript_8574/m.25129 type:complete len:282 (+) Transcript_8574:27-872(+)